MIRQMHGHGASGANGPRAVLVMLLIVLSLGTFVVFSFHAYVTLITSDDYGIGVRVLAQSLREHNSSRNLVVLVTDGVSQSARQDFLEAGLEVLEIEGIKNPQPSAIQAGNARFLDTYTKLRVWQLTRFEKIVFLDADCIVLKNIDELFEYDEFAAAPECCDRLNSGVFVAEPSEDTFQDMLQKLHVLRSYDGGDQGFLNEYFPRWTQLAFKYNGLQNHYVNDARAWRMQDIKVLHYVKYKPWQPIPEQLKANLLPLHERWWYYHDRMQQRL